MKPPLEEHKADAGASAKADADVPVKADAGAPVKADAATPVDADEAAPDMADAATSVKADAATPVDADAATPDKADAATPVKADAGAPVKADAATPVKADASTPVNADEAAHDKEDADAPVWFAMRATYRRELVAKGLLDAAGIENYIPMRHMRRVVHGRKKDVIEPSIHNLIFVRTTHKTIQDFKKNLLFLQYMIKRTGSERGIPIIIPDGQMEAFIKFTRHDDGSLTYLCPEGLHLEKGMRVRLINGPQAGMEGTLVKLPGMKDKRVVVALDWVLAVASAAVPPSWLEKVE